VKLLLILFTLTSCGVSESIRSECGSDIEMGCNALFGYKDGDQDKSISDIEKKNAEQDEKISLLEQQTQSLIINIETLSEASGTSGGVITYLQNSINANLIQMLSLNATILNLQGEVADLQANNSSVSEIIDPCGDESGYDEVILKLNGGQYLAYFQHGNNRFLTLLPAGNYETSDSSSCAFSITESGLITY
jgi:hypothetical protein